MKIRNGLVSNSSTSSFLVLGWYFDRAEFEQFLKMYCENKQINIESKEPFYEFVSNITVQDTELNNVIHSVDYELLMGERIFTTNISEIKNIIIKFEKDCKNEKHMFALASKIAQPIMIEHIIPEPEEDI